MTGGYAGKILVVNLTTGAISTKDTAKYAEKYGGAHGIGTAIFWELAVAPGEWDLLDGFDPRNVVTLMSGPLTGTPVSMVGRTEVQGVNVYSIPVGWFSRSGFGGRFGNMMKWAGWDGVVIVGKASSPVWINIINDDVTIEDASGLWKLNTWDAQREIHYRVVTSKVRFGEWLKLPGGEKTTQLPAVVVCGQAGENMSRIGALMHDGGSGAGHGGFGGVFGSKNLKAISVLGTGSLEIADPDALVDTRVWLKNNFAYNVDNPVQPGTTFLGGQPGGGATLALPYFEDRRVTGCSGCHQNCRIQTRSGSANDSQCVECVIYFNADPRKTGRGIDLVQQYGIDATDMLLMIPYIRDLYKMGVLGPGKTIDPAPLHMEDYGSMPWIEQFLEAIASRIGIGEALAGGTPRAAMTWGRWDEDSDTGLLGFPVWGNLWHHMATPYWLYGSLFGDRDINEHGGEQYAQRQVYQKVLGTPREDMATPEKLVNMFATKTPPGFTGDPFMWDMTWQGPNREHIDQAIETGWYSKHSAKNIAWRRYYSRFWQQGMGFCDWHWPSWLSVCNPDLHGSSPEGELRFFNAVTGLNMSFAESIKIGRRVWNMERAIWVLQGRHRDMENFAEYEYKKGTVWGNAVIPIYRNGTWEYTDYNVPERAPFVDREGHEILKTNYYEFEGWDTSNGWPSRATLEGLDLGFVADRLAAEGKLGATGVYQGP